MGDQTQRERLLRIAEWDDAHRELDADWRARTVADPFSRHEALHVANLFAGMVDEHLLGHPFILLHPHLYELADSATAALAALYQAVANVPEVGIDGEAS